MLKMPRGEGERKVGREKREGIIPLPGAM